MHLYADTPSTCVLRWGTIDTPGGYPQRNDIRTPCEISELAVSADGKVIFALDIPDASSGPVFNAGLWKSSDGGISWSSRPTRWLAQATPAPVFPVADIAISPDDCNLIAVVCMDAAGTHRREVYISEDGGTNWSYSAPIPWVYGPNEQAGSIAISASYTHQEKSVRDIIIGSRAPADGLGQGEVYVLRHPGFAGWQPQGHPGGDIITLAASPAYSLDSTIVVMASTTQRTSINLGYRDLGANGCSWNENPGWPVELCIAEQGGGTGSGESRIITGDMALPSDFIGSTAAGRVIFASYDSNGSSMGASQVLDDIYRLNDTLVTRLKVPDYGNKPRISSIDYAGNIRSGKLLAGAVMADAVLASSAIWFTDNPLDTCPVWKKPLKAPTGGYITGYGNAKVAFTKDGLTAFAGTGSGNRDTPIKWADPTGLDWAAAPLDESAFSTSIDDGASWNQLGLIDTRINRFRAVAPAENGKTIFVSSGNDNGLDSTWRSQTNIAGDAWQRVLCSDTSAPLLRLSPDKDDGDCIFLGNQGTVEVWHSRDSGQIWQSIQTGAMLQDMAASEDSELHILQANGLARRGNYDQAGWHWDKFVDTGLNIAHTIVAQQNHILAGAALGQSCPASYSPDNGVTWTMITEPAYSSGNRHVAFDDEFNENRMIYMADDAGGLYRWTIGNSNRWDDMTPPHNSYYGIIAAPGGVFYSAYSPQNVGVDRSIYSRGGIPKSGISWDSLEVGLNNGVLFRLEPVSLQYSVDTIWAIDTRDYSPFTGVGCLWAFRDTLAGRPPWLIAPKANSPVYCDPVTGRNAQVDLKWEQLSLADAYEIEIGKDKWFDLVVTEAAPGNNPFHSPADLLYPSYYIGGGMLPEAGHTYYWRVRVRRAATGQSIRSHWSYALSFCVQPGYRVTAQSYPGMEPIQPCRDACNVPVYPVSFSWTGMQGTNTYNFVLAADPALERPIINETVKGTSYKLFTRLSNETAYFWQVTPVEPVAGDPSPVFSFVTRDAAAPAPSPDQPQPVAGDQANTIVLMVFTLAILISAVAHAILYHRRHS